MQNHLAICFEKNKLVIIQALSIISKYSRSFQTTLKFSNNTYSSRKLDNKYKIFLQNFEKTTSFSPLVPGIKGLTY